MLQEPMGGRVVWWGNLTKVGREGFPEDVTLELLSDVRGSEVGKCSGHSRHRKWPIQRPYGRGSPVSGGGRQGPDPQDFVGL